MNAWTVSILMIVDSEGTLENATQILIAEYQFETKGKAVSFLKKIENGIYYAKVKITLHSPEGRLDEDWAWMDLKPAKESALWGIK